MIFTTLFNKQMRLTGLTDGLKTTDAETELSECCEEELELPCEPPAGRGEKGFQALVDQACLLLTPIYYKEPKL